MSTRRALVLLVTALLLAWLLPWGRLPVEPDLVLIVAVLVAVARPPIEGVLLAAIAGAMQDALSVEVFGARAASLAVVAWAAGRLARELSVETLRARMLLLAVAIGLAGSLRWLIGSVAANAAPAAPGAIAAVTATVMLGALLWRRLSAARPQRAVW